MRFISLVRGAVLAGAVVAMSAPAFAEPATWAEYRLAAARRIAQANAQEIYSGAVPEPLKSIPVLQVNLNADGSISSIAVVRTPAVPGTVDMAMQAIARAAPFAPVGQLPKPWRFTETFLYNDELKFQLRTLAELP